MTLPTPQKTSWMPINIYYEWNCKKKRKWHNKTYYNNQYDTAILNKVNWTNDEQKHKEGRHKQDGLNSHMLEDIPNLLLS
jgi:hypothetical protein